MSLILPTKEFLDVFKSTPGALSVTESICIMNLAKDVILGTAIELGSHKGKSAMSAGLTMKVDAFYLVDPIFEDKALGDEVTDKVFDASEGWELTAVLPIADYSVNVIKEYAPYVYVFWDSGEHGGDTLKKETELLEDALLPGGLIVSHDIGNQFIAQKEAMDYLVSTGKYEWIPIDWKPIIDYVMANNLEDGNQSWHVYPDLPHPPNFVGAVRRK